MWVFQMHNCGQMSPRAHLSGRNSLRLSRAAACAILSACIFWSCTVPGSGPQHSGASLAQQAQILEDVKIMREELRSLKSSQEASPVQPLQESIIRITERLNELERSVAALEKSSNTDRTTWDKKLKAVIEVVKNENDQLRNAIETAQKRSGPTGSEHTVKRGDTLLDIARKYGVREKDIIEANGLKDANIIAAGQKLIIPRSPR